VERRRGKEGGRRSRRGGGVREKEDQASGGKSGRGEERARGRGVVDIFIYGRGRRWVRDHRGP
jgi:hypothetical protein